MTPTDKFVEAMRDLWDMRQPDSATWEHMQKDIRQAVEAFADADCGCCCCCGHHDEEDDQNHAECRTALLKRVMK